MKVLITGGSGYVGAGILRRAPRDWQLAATHFAHSLEREGVAAYVLDVRDAHAVNVLCAQSRPEVVIHTAALMAGEAMMQVNVDGARNVARAAHRLNARLIHLSSDVIFDGEHAPYDETNDANPITPYALSKAIAETVVRKAHPDAVIVRTSLVYGFDPMDPRTRQTLNGEMPRLFTDEFRCPIHVDDLADALIELATHRYCGTINLAGAQRLSRYEFGLQLARHFGVAPKFEPVLSASSPAPRPRDCTLNITLAQQVLRTHLRGVEQVLRETNS